MSGEGTRLSSQLLADKADDIINSESTCLCYNIFVYHHQAERKYTNMEYCSPCYDDNQLVINWIVLFELFGGSGTHFMKILLSWLIILLGLMML